MPLNSSGKSAVLPKLQDSINSHNLSALDNLERRVKYFKEKCDFTYNKNRSLTFQLRDLRKIELNDSSFGKESIISADFSRKIAEIDEKILRVEEIGNKFCNERVRILSILDICKKNKQVSKFFTL
jgi:hypothetical protein